MFDHGWTLIYRDPFTDRARFLNVNERGSLAQGALSMRGDTVIWDWRATELAGETNRYHVETIIEPENPDAHSFRLCEVNDDESVTELVNISYERVDEAPRDFKRLRSAAHPSE